VASGEAEWSSDRRAEILVIATELFAQDGVAATSMRDIGRAAGILGGSLYHHFESKQAMLAEILLDYLLDLTARYKAVRAASPDPRVALEGLIQASFDSIATHPMACRIWQNTREEVLAGVDGRRFRRLSNTIRRHWIDVVEAGIASGHLRADISAGTYYALARGAIWSAVSLGGPLSAVPLERERTEFTMVLMDGFTAR
jgi:AcrR family transcriptional regulator